MKNKLLRPLTSILIITLLAVIALLTWRFEIIYVVGWDGLAWLETTLYSPIIISALVALSIIVPFNIYLADQITKNKIVAFMVLFAFGFISYLFGKMLIFSSFKGWLYMPTGFYVIFVLTPIIISFVICLIIRLRLIKVSWWYAGGVFLAILGTIFCSFLLDVDTVKEGRPFFWIVFFCGVISIFTANRMRSLSHYYLEFDDNILDNELVSQRT